MTARTVEHFGPATYKAARQTVSADKLYRAMLASQRYLAQSAR